MAHESAVAFSPSFIDLRPSRSSSWVSTFGSILKTILSNIESQTGSGASSQTESFGEISFTMKFDLEITNKDGTNRLLINVINCRKIPRIPLVSHPYIKGILSDYNAILVISLRNNYVIFELSLRNDLPKSNLEILF